ncbi:DUF6314 family protein [Streptomyces sp. LX-29]|uniref:DUF6314 family protein n=1 Tax=Streptomyces sp. LX-29 TaxID=2900152 RepID=UPI00240E70E4|nr:DUF6314 family protein [Streptomyces sp. LX-29]WFB06068.1 DUF6314 family protein [Streptomyces sp. LX-29]
MNRTTSAPPPATASSAYPVSDVAAYLSGWWTVERAVVDLASGASGRFHGTAEFRPSDDGSCVLHIEEGELTWAGTTRRASRTLRLLPRPDGTAEVAFADGRPFHVLDLRGGHWAARHLCSADRYDGDFTAVSPDEWRLRWHAVGPSKNQRMESTYRRRGRGVPA